MNRLINVALAALFVTGAEGAWCTAAAQASASRAVLVTGASSGIGREITERLASRASSSSPARARRQDLEALEPRFPTCRRSGSM